MTLPDIMFDQDPARYITPSWQDLDQLTFKVAQAVNASQQKIDTVVALAKGAWPMSRSLVDYLGVNELVSLGVKFYSGINQRLAKPQVYQKLPVSVAGKNVLLFDDVADSGESLIFASQYLLDQGAASVTTATLFFKERSAITPDYYGALTDAWIIFPFEIREMMQLLGQNWRKQGLDAADLKQRFIKLGFAENLIKYFSQQKG